MAPGPPPAEVRRRRNEPARGEWQDLEPLEKPVLPELPEYGGVEEDEDGELVPADWPEGTKAVWEGWRSDPVTALWSPADVGYALDTIWLHAQMTATTANEVRLRMDGLGLTPKGKRDLRYRLPKQTPSAARQGAQASRHSAQRRSRLSVVK